MKPVNREQDLVMDLAQAALSNRKNAIDLAGRYAITLIERISELMDERMSDEEKLEEIRKIVFRLF